MLDREIKILSEQLSKALNTPIEASFLGNGSIGKAIKLVTNNDKALVLKVNHADPKYGLERGHGIQIEGVRGMFVSSNDDRDKYVKTYFVRTGQKNAADSFIISRFIEQPDTQVPEKISQQQADSDLLLQVKTSDGHKDNMVGGVYIDLGGCYIPKHMRDPQCYKIFKTLYKSLKRKDGVQIIKKVEDACARNPELQKKLEMVKASLAKTLTNDSPDIDYEGRVTSCEFYPECMEVLGVSNQLDVFEALSRAKNNEETLDYILKSRGGSEKISKMFEDMGGNGDFNYISLDVAEYFMDKGVSVTSITRVLRDTDADYFKKMVIQKEKELKTKNNVNISPKEERNHLLFLRGVTGYLREQPKKPQTTVNNIQIPRLETKLRA